MTIRQTLYAALLVLAAVGALGGVTTFVSSRDQQALLAQASADFNNLATNNLALLQLTKDIQTDVIQVQQFLTDVSATRATAGLDTGFAEAEEQTAEFKANTAKAIALAHALKLPEVESALRKAEAAFASYHDAGVTMAQAYVSGGPAAGNKFMSGFDEKSDLIQAEIAQVDHMVGAVQAVHRLLPIGGQRRHGRIAGEFFAIGRKPEIRKHQHHAERHHANFKGH